MHHTIKQTFSYTKISHYSSSVKFLSPPIPTSPHFHSLSSDHPSPYLSSAPYPPSNFTGFETRPTFYQDPIAVSPNWVLTQTPPLPNSLPLNKEGIASTSYDVSSSNTEREKKLVKNVPKRKLKCKKANLKKTSANRKLYEKHLSRKKHGNSCHKICATSTNSSVVEASQSKDNGCNSEEKGIPYGTSRVPSGPDNSATKKQKLLEGGCAIESMRVCTICNVTCNGEVAFADHLTGKKHAAQERVLCSKADPNPVISPSNGRWWCEVCEISCTSSDTLVTHKQGKKHQKNLNKLQKMQTIHTSVPLAVSLEC